MRLLRLGPQRIALLIEAMAALAAARLTVRRKTPAAVLDRLGRTVALDDVAADRPLSASQGDQACLIRWAIGSAAARAPFRALCLEQALAARAMLDRRAIPAIAHYGIAPEAKDGDHLIAHVWTDAAGHKITGYPLRRSFREIARFTSGRLQDSHSNA